MKQLQSDKIALALSQSRTLCNKSQKFMANALGKSLGTIKNWENGYATPNLNDTITWFQSLGLNPLYYMLNFVYPDDYETKNFNNASDVDATLIKYITEIAPESEKRKLAYCIFGNTGSDWASQVDMLTAHNHLSMRSRVNVAQTILDNYEIDSNRDELLGDLSVLPSVDNLRLAVKAGKEAASNKRNSYITLTDSSDDEE